MSRLTNFLNLEKKQIGQIGGGKNKPTGIIDVAIIQSLYKKGVVNDLVAQYGYLIVDECHHISAFSFEQVARQCKAKYVTGLSATTIRKDGHHPIIFMQCGPIRYQVHEKTQSLQRPFTYKVIVHKTKIIFPEGSHFVNDPSINDIYTFLINNETRNNNIIEDIVLAVSEKRSPLVLTERREHLEYFEEKLSSKIQNTVVFKGVMGKKQRKAVIEKLENIQDDEPRIILSTGRYLGEGFDDSRLDTLFLTLPISWRGTIVQYAGRLHRLHNMKKEVIIHDYADLNIPVLEKMYSRRCKGYKAIGYKILD